MKTVLVLSNHPTWTYKLRAEVLQQLVRSGYRVIVAVGNGSEIDKLKAIGCEHVDIPYNRRSVNPLKEWKLYRAYRKLIKAVRPDAVLTYTIKPNLYGAFLCKKNGIPCLVNITGLGSALEKKGFLRCFFLRLYRYVFRDVYRVFLQNASNRELFISLGIVHGNDVLLPGSGVNVEQYRPLPYPSDETVEFVFVSRILRAKGIEEYIGAARFLKEKYPFTRFHICGFCDEDYMALIDEMVKKGVVDYHGMVEDVRAVYQVTHCTVLPSWYAEGMNNVLLESAASARPVITTGRPGCGEIVDDGVNGFIVNPQDTDDLIEKMERFILLPADQKEMMGMYGRRKVETAFDRRIVVERYLEAVNSLFA